MPAQSTKSKVAAAPEKPRSVVLSPGRMGLKEHRMNAWAVTAPAGATQDDVIKQDFWSLISDKLRPYDEIDVIANDATWLMKLKVLSCDRTWAHVHTLHTYELEPAGQPEKSLR